MNKKKKEKKRIIILSNGKGEVPPGPCCPLTPFYRFYP